MPNRLAQYRSSLILLFIGLVMQILTYKIAPDSPWSLVSGMFGVCSIVLGTQGNILSFVFGFAQVATYAYLCCIEHFYAEIAINLYYFATMLYGVYCWHRRLQPNQSMTISTRSLSWKMLPLWVIVIVILSLAIGWLLAHYTNDSQPYMDAFTTVPSIAAQLLMVLAYREQWILWLGVDILSAVMWWRADNYCMVVQYLFWSLLCVYGYYKWTKLKNQS